jgi:hypothetical protein
MKKATQKYLLPCLAIAFTIALVGFALAENWPFSYENVSNPISLAQVLDKRVGSIETDIANLKAHANLGTGKVFYVDSAVGADTYTGTTPATATATIDAAVNLCEASRGDVIYVMQGHAETFIAQSLDVDVIGVTIIGLGNGSLRPTITYNHANAEVAIGADNCSISNMRFVSSVTGVLMGIEVEDGVDYFTITDCEFTDAGDAVGDDEFVEAINFVNNNTGCTIERCRFNAKAAGAASAIMLDADTNQLTIRNNDIRGDYSVACIAGDTTASTDILIQGNLLINGSLVADTGINTVAAISLLEATAGLICDNRIVSDVGSAALMRIADDCVFMNNYVSDTDGDEFSGTKEDDATSVTGFVDGD